MAILKVVEIKSLSDYAKQVERLLEGTRKSCGNASAVANWYRGHGRSDTYELVPGLYRHPRRKSFDELYQVESDMMSHFMAQGLLHDYHPEPGGSGNGFHQMFYMQHHGVPTRLLDWTGNPFIALYFALAGASADGGSYLEGAAVWVLDPFKWNGFALSDLNWPKKRGPADPLSDDIKSYEPAQPGPARPGVKMYPWPFALRGKANTPRMQAQRGQFTLFGEDTRSMEKIYESEKFPAGALVKLEVPADKISPMLETLIALGYTDSVAYPDLQGLAMEIKRLYGFFS